MSTISPSVDDPRDAERERERERATEGFQREAVDGVATWGRGRREGERRRGNDKGVGPLGVVVNGLDKAHVIWVAPSRIEFAYEENKKKRPRAKAVRTHGLLVCLFVSLLFLVHILLVSLWPKKKNTSFSSLLLFLHYLTSIYTCDFTSLF